MLESNIYKKSPVMLQNLLLIGKGFLYNFLRQGKTFKKIFSELESTQYFDESKIRDWQNEKLNLLVHHAYENVPYYNRIFKKFGISPNDIRYVEDLRRLPILTKEDVRKNSRDLIAKNINKFFLHKVFTSGTSGKPLKLYRDLYSINFENAIISRQRNWVGIDFNDRIAVFKDNPIVPFYIKRPPFWRYSVSEKRLFFSIDHLSRKNTSYYVRALQDFRPVAIEGEPSSLYIISKFIKNQGIPLHLPSIKAIFTSSEMLLTKHRELIEEVFGVHIYDFYGSVERVAAIGMCEEGNYHSFPEYGITEFLPLDGEAGKMEIIGTSLHNYAMPLLRYRTEDIVQLSRSDCKCGRKFKVIRNIEGRLADYFVCQDGRFIGGFYSVLACIENIIESQIIQEDLDRMRIRFVPTKDFSKKDEKKIMDNVRKYIGSEVELILEVCWSLRKLSTLNPQMWGKILLSR